VAQDLKVIVEAQELAKELLPVVARFPRTPRYALGDRIEGRMLDVIELLDQAPARFAGAPTQACRCTGRSETRWPARCAGAPPGCEAGFLGEPR